MSANLQGVVDRYLRAEISAPIAVMELLLEMPDLDALTRELPTLRGAASEIQKLSALLERHAEGCSTIGGMLRSGVDSPLPPESVEHGLELTRRLFDYSVTRSEEASVALYSLGSPELLARATEEAVQVLAAWGVLSAERDALEIGCGIGRFLEALSPRLRSVVGTDVSANMVSVAARRTAERKNVSVKLTAGRDLSDFAADSFDLVYSIDAFPYLVRAGRSLVVTHFHEVARVLRARGDFVIFNYAYGRPRKDDADEVCALAREAGYVLERLDETPFELWNAVAFQLKKA